jgi:Na+/melibiose symporter-like transporter
LANLKAKVGGLVKDVKMHWNEPPKGRYMPFKEIVSYAGGGIGVKFLAVMATNMILSATNVLIGNTLGVEPIDMYIMYFISVIVNIPLSGIRANIIDNTRSKEGKYRPYIVKMGIPSAIVTILFVWFPYNQFGALFGEGTVFGKPRAYVITCAIILVLNFIQNFFYYFFSEAYDNLIHVLSPNTQERADVSTIKGVIYSLAPSILSLAMPIFAQLFTNNNMYDIRLYRYIYPPLAILSVMLSIVVYVNTKEKIVQAKTHVIQIKFMDSLREVLRNKYFWVIAMATWLGFLESSMTVVLNWLYNYGGIYNGAVNSVITLICQNAGLVGMLIAPFAIRKWGKRFVLISTNVLNIVFIGLMFPVIRTIDMTGESNSALNTWIPIILLVICYWMNNLMNAFMQILTPSVNADIRDYQQYVSGERIDGMFSTITAIGGLVTVASSGIVNLLYDKFGINTETAAQVMNDPEVMNKVLRNGSVVKEVIAQADTSSISYFSLYDSNILQTMCGVLIIASMIGAFINVVPYFFYDLTELKQQGMVRVLKIRAFFEDFGNHALSDDNLVEVVDMVENAKEIVNEEPAKITKDGIKAAKKKAKSDERLNAAIDNAKASTGTKEQIKAAVKQAKQNKKDAVKEAVKLAKEDRRAAILRNQEIKLAPFVLKEISRFDTSFGKLQTEHAQKIYEEGLEGLSTHSISELRKKLKDAKRLPKGTEEEKEFRQYMVHFARTRLTARKYQEKYYGANAIAVPDDTKLNALFETEEQYDKKEDNLYKSLYEAQETKNKSEIHRIKGEIKSLKADFRELNKKIRDEQNHRTNYNRSAKPYLDARNLLRQAENYTHFDEIKELYNEIRAREIAEETVTA